MSEISAYVNIIESKSGCKIPIFESGKSVDSRYDPYKESSRICRTIKKESRFLIVTGIASGILIQSILQSRPDVFILAIESSRTDLDFLRQLELVKELEKNERVSFAVFENLKEKLLQLYIPSFYGNLQLVEQAGWILEKKDELPELQKIIQNTLNQISADYSVQAHFGKLWHHNIMSNLKLINKAQALPKLKDKLIKTALILGAGPGLESKIEEIKLHRNNYYLIATDTAFTVLNNAHLIPDCVISLDGQNISTRHFIHSNTDDYSNTLFLFDLTANPSAVRKALLYKGNLSFYISGHPLSHFINKSFDLKLPELFTGSGTVTISALDFAVKNGFSKILVFGADFAYLNGKAYAKGTYLDNLYNSKSSRFISAEKQFDNLLFRTPLLKKSEKAFTTSLLDSYRLSFESYLEMNKIKFFHKDNAYILDKSLSCPSLSTNFNIKKISSADTLQKEIAEKILNKTAAPQALYIYKKLAPELISLLPLISWLRFYDNNKEADFSFYLQKAASYFKKYLGGN